MNKPQDISQWLGTGIYTVAEAARLAGLSQGRVRRWVKGYEFRRAGQIRTSPPVVKGEYLVDSDQPPVLSFKDLVELRCVLGFLEKGVRWPLLREAHEKASQELKTDHPFATRRFITDGRGVLMRLGKQALLDVVERQLSFYRLIEEYLLDAVDFQNDLSPVRWWPMGRKSPVVIDAERSFGQPIIENEAVPTAVLHRAYVAESRKDENFLDHLARSFNESALSRVASWFVVGKRSVRAAIEYEQKLAA